MGGHAGLGAALAIATEFQGDGTSHGHGFVALHNMFQFNNLETIAEMIDNNIHELPGQAMLNRITNFIEYVQCEDHIDDAKHQASLDKLEEQFHHNNFGPPENVYLSLRTAGMHLRVSPDTGSAQTPYEDARLFREAYDADVQFIFSRVQHHWHLLNKDGQRVPMQYCAQKGRRKQSCCKRGFPKKVIKGVRSKYRARIICKGVAAELDLR